MMLGFQDLLMQKDVLILIYHLEKLLKQVLEFNLDIFRIKKKQNLPYSIRLIFLEVVIFIWEKGLKFIVRL